MSRHPTHARCPECGRILARNNDGGLPAHRKPPVLSPIGRTSMPLTGTDRPWCAKGMR